MSNTNATELAEEISQKIQDSTELIIDSTLLSAEEILSSSDVSEFLQSANDLQIGSEIAYRSSFNEDKSDRVALALSDKIAKSKNYFFKRNREIETPFVLQIKKSDGDSIHVRFEVESKLGNAEIFMVNRDISDSDVYGITDGSFYTLTNIEKSMKHYSDALHAKCFQRLLTKVLDTAFHYLLLMKKRIKFKSQKTSIASI